MALATGFPTNAALLKSTAAVDWEKTAKTEGAGFVFVSYRRK